MATLVSTAVVSVREDLSDVIANISPADTPVYTVASKETQSSTKHEFLVQELNAPADNKKAEGADFSDGTSNQPTRFDNMAQIMHKVIKVSDTVENLNIAGRASQIAYEKVMAGQELKKDLERALLVDYAKVPSGTREMAGISSYISHGDFATNMAAASNLDGTDVPDATGTATALTMARVEAALQAAYEDGGSPRLAVMSPAVKRKFSAATDGFTASTQAQVQHTKAEPIQFVSAVSVFLSDFGSVETVPNRVMAAASLNDRIYLVDPDYITVTNLPNRNFVTHDLAKTADAETFAMVFEGSNKLTAPKAHALVLGIS